MPGKQPEEDDVKHLFVCAAHPTTMRPSDLWRRLMDAVHELSYLEARDPDLNEHVLKGEQQQVSKYLQYYS